jgi:hypothetical protein
MKPNPLLLSLLVAFSLSSTFAASVDNIRTALDEHDRLVVTYNLTGGEPSAIFLSVSEDGGQNYDTPLSVSGDVGPNIAPGSGKKIVWDILADTPKLQTDKLVARVSTIPPELVGQALAPNVLEGGLSVRPKGGLKTRPPRGEDIHRGMLPPQSRLRLLTQSAIVPGWGQIATGRKRGYLYLLGTAAGLAAAYWTTAQYADQKDKYDAALAAYNRPRQTLRQRKDAYDKMDKAYNEMGSYQDQNMAALGVVGAIWAWNLIEIGTIDLGLSPAHAGLSLNFNF